MASLATVLAHICIITDVGKPKAIEAFGVGGVLLALIFIVDSYLPKLPIVENADPHRPKIRIYSDDRWPERCL
jgi:hypothetical protein